VPSPEAFTAEVFVMSCRAPPRKQSEKTQLTRKVPSYLTVGRGNLCLEG